MRIYRTSKNRGKTLFVDCLIDEEICELEFLIIGVVAAGMTERRVGIVIVGTADARRFVELERMFNDE